MSGSSRCRLLNRIARLRHQFPKVAPSTHRGAPQRMAFYLPSDPESFASLKENYDDIDTVISASGNIDVNAGKVVATPDPAYVDFRRRSLHQPERLLMVQNITDEKFDGPGMARLLARRGAINALAVQIDAAADAGRWQGVVFDIEDLPASAQAAYLRLIAATHARLAKQRQSLALTVQAGEETSFLHQVTPLVDNVILMDYDYHWQGGEPGPIAPQDWFAQQYALARKLVPQNKLIVAIGSYGYDWHNGAADAMTVNEAWLAAHDSDAMPVFDPVSGNSGFAYSEGTENHTVWLMDAATSWNQLRLIGGSQRHRAVAAGERGQGVLGGARRIPHRQDARSYLDRARAGHRHRGQWRNPANRCAAHRRQADDRLR